MADATMPTLKRLFALSGNRCAFPRCQVALTDANGTKGKACHIKGENPTSARYDPAQTDDERRHYDNLILMCGTHHDVIDQDEESYTVARLLKLKADHEKAMGTMPDADAERGAMLLMTMSVVTTNQSGGIAANVVHVHNAPPSATNPKTAEAIDKIWNAMLRMNSEFHDVLLAEMILTKEEIDAYFKGDSWEGTLYSINDYKSQYAVQHKMQRAGVLDLDPLAIHASSEMWRAFNLHRALIGRLGVLYEFSFRRSAYQDWRTDTLFTNAASEAVGKQQLARARSVPLSGAQLVINAVDAYFRSLVARSN